MDNQSPSTRIELADGEGEGALLDQRVAERLRAMIMAGTLPPESRLPTEPELSTLLSVSRSTLRSALTILEQSGFALRRRGVGTFVATEQPMYAFLRERLSLDVHHGIAWLRPQMAENYIAEKLGIAAGSSLLYIEQVDYDADGRPIALAGEFYVADDFTFSVYRTG
jgi:DNA-binding GntR family transcriptional regulator